MVLEGCGLAERGRGGCLGWSVYGKDWHAEEVLTYCLNGFLCPLTLLPILIIIHPPRAICTPAWGVHGQ